MKTSIKVDAKMSLSLVPFESHAHHRHRSPDGLHSSHAPKVSHKEPKEKVIEPKLVVLIHSLFLPCEV